MTAPLIDPNIPSTIYVFHSLFLVSTQQAALHTEQDLEMFGLPSTGFRQYDEDLAGANVQCHLPISQLAELFNKGYKIDLLVHADAKRVYEYVQYHLDSWMTVVRCDMNQTKAPYDDLLLLDRFAASVYGVAAHQYEKADATTAFGRFFAQFADLSEAAFSLVTPAAAEEDKIKPRQSLQDDLLEIQSRYVR